MLVTNEHEEPCGMESIAEFLITGFLIYDTVLTDRYFRETYCL
jgi:hypothetical protein